MASAKRRRVQLTTPDLVLLSLLAERPMHGYQANAELERREIRDWAAISRPQIYYSLEKLLRGGMLRDVEDEAGSSASSAARGPERRVFATTAAGRRALAEALDRENWAQQRERPPLLTWLALSWLARPNAVQTQLARRRRYLEQQLARERATLAAVRAEVGHEHHEAVWMIRLMIAQFETELRWLAEVERELPRRAAAKHPPK